MKADLIRLSGVRCFEDTGEIPLSPSMNIFVGHNNAGKSTILKSLLNLQGFPFTQRDLRPGSSISYSEVQLSGIAPNANVRARPDGESRLRVVYVYKGSVPNSAPTIHTVTFQDQNPTFSQHRPGNVIVPFIAKRKAVAFDQTVNLGIQAEVSGTHRNLVSLIDEVATAGHPDHEKFLAAMRDIVGIDITTKASGGGKEAGAYLGRHTFITLEQMGDGVSEMVSLIVALCVEEDKIFVIEEPETNLHPTGLKSLLRLMRDAGKTNQFIVATHSNIVVRELATEPDAKLFRVSRTATELAAPSEVSEVPETPQAHVALLRDLGYEFADFGLHEAWLFLEESSAERIIRDILIPQFEPSLKNKLRTFSCGGVGKVSAAVADFQRLVTFIHLQPVYKETLWVRTDGDTVGRDVVAKLVEKFPFLEGDRCAPFSEPDFERFYPGHFRDEVDRVLAMPKDDSRRAAKLDLLEDVLNWTRQNMNEARAQWEASASEPIGLLRLINQSLMATPMGSESADGSD